MNSISIFLFIRPFRAILALGLLAQLAVGCSSATASPSAVASTEYPNPPTFTPFLLPTSISTPFPLPTSTFTPTPAYKKDFQVQGQGDFPLFPIIATASDGKTLALFRVEGDTATQLRAFEGTSWMSDHISLQTSPDKQYVAALLQTANGQTALEVIRISDAESYLIVRGVGKLNPHEKGSAFESIITSLAWLDNEHLAYSKIVGSKKEIWISGVDGKEQRLLAAAPIQRVLGGSPNGKTLYVTRLLPDDGGWRIEGFALLDIASGKLEYLWPAEEHAPFHYYGIGMVVLPDGTSRVELTYLEQGPGTTVATSPPKIWIGNPESRELEFSWRVNHAKGDIVGATYASPNAVLWSPRSKQEFIYSADGIWKVDLSSRTERRLVKAGNLSLWAWTPQGFIISDNLTGALQLLDQFGWVKAEIPLGYIPDRW